MNLIRLWVAVACACGAGFAFRVGWLLIEEARLRRTEKISYE